MAPDNPHPDPARPRLSFLQTTALIRNKTPAELTSTEAEEVRSRMEESPELRVMLGGEGEFDRYLEALKLRMDVPEGAPAPQTPNRKNRVMWKAAAAMLALAGVAMLWTWLAQEKPSVHPQAKSRTPPSPASAVPVAEAPAIPTADAAVVAAPVVEVAAESEPKVEVEAAPMAEKIVPPAPPEAPVPANIDGTIVLNDPEGEYRLPAMAADKVKLRGRIKTLIVASLDGSAEVDASELNAQNIEVSGEINGNAKLKLNAPQGRIEIPRTINGMASVEISAPGGTVILGRENREAVNGATRLKVIAADVDIRGTVAGSAIVDLMMDGAGKLRFARLTGSVRMSCGQEPGTPALSVLDRGRIDPGAVFAAADPGGR